MWLEICLATIGVCDFRCVDFGWRIFLFFGGKMTMEKNLYQQLLDAVTVLLHIDQKEKEIQQAYGMIENERWALSQKYWNVYKKPSAGFIIGGILLLYFPIAGLVGAVIFIMAGEFLASVEGTVLPILATVGWIPSILLFAKRAKLKRIRKKRIQEYEILKEEQEASFRMAEDALEVAKSQVKQFKEETEHYLAFLKPSYDNLIATLYLFKCVRDGRADTLKEAKNLYETQLHNWKVEKILGDMVRMQNIQQEFVANALDEISQNQKNINSTLQTIQTVQIMNSLKN